jgi:hypothetical protein
MTRPTLSDRAEPQPQTQVPANPDLVSARLDERHVRRERIRKRLMWAGLSWWCGLGWVVALIAVSVAGGSESNEGLVLGVVFGSGTIASIALMLSGYLVGRRNADWWRPRLKEVPPNGSKIGDRECGTRRGARRRSSERRERDRYAIAKQVRLQLREAQIHERRRDGNGTLLSEPILVLHTTRDRTLDVFDQEGNELGRIIRVLHRTSKAEGDVWMAQVHDTHSQIVFTVRLAPRRRRPKREAVKTGSYAICSADGKPVATIGPPTTSDKRSTRQVTVGRQLLAHIEEYSKFRLTVADTTRRKIAEMSRPSGVNSQSGWYVINRTGAVDEPLRGLVIAAGIVWDDTCVEND